MPRSGLLVNTVALIPFLYSRVKPVHTKSENLKFTDWWRQFLSVKWRWSQIIGNYFWCVRIRFMSCAKTGKTEAADEIIMPGVLHR